MISIRTYSFAAFFGVGVVPLLVLAVGLSYDLHRGAVRDARDHLTMVTTEVSERIGEIMGGIEKDLSSLQSNPIFRNPESSKANRGAEMDRLLRIYEQFHDLAFYTPEGNLVSATNVYLEDPAPYREYTSWFRTAVTTGERTVSRPTRRLGIEGLFAVVYLPIEKDRETNVPLGVIRASVRFDKVIDMLAEVDLGKDGQLILIDENGLVLHQRQPGSTLERFSDPAVWDQWRSARSGRCAMAGENWMFADQVLLKEQTRVGVKWFLIGLLSEAEVLGSVESARNMMA
ncbi:MAG: cache domain-containing protein, partial [Verrucomicrobiales bacterium]